MINVGSELKRLLAWFFQSASPVCKCEPRADLLDLLGPRWTRDNLETVVDWLIEEAEERGMSNASFQEMERAIARRLILICCRRAEKKHRDTLRLSR